MNRIRRISKEVQIGSVKIGGNNPIAIQSMTNTRTEDVKATVAQILQLEKAGCQIIRCTVPTPEAAAALERIARMAESIQNEDNVQKTFNRQMGGQAAMKMVLDALEKAESEPDVKALLDKIDYLIDGPFILAQRDLTLQFRGSRNQRYLDMNRTRSEGKPAEI